MNWIDIIILIPLAFGAYKGFTKGLFTELVMLVALVAATVVSFKLLHKGIALLTPYIGENETVLPLLSFIIIFVLVIFGITLLGKAMKTVLDITLLGTMDNFAGAVFGALKWAFGFSTFLWLLESAGIHMPEELAGDSVIYPYFVEYGPVLIEWMSKLIPYAKELVGMIKDLIYVKAG